jgi:mRNA-degrading endonuclease RelE of RelBE toxin-antitoxin system
MRGAPVPTSLGPALTLVSSSRGGTPLSEPSRRRIRTGIERKPTSNPIELGKPLRYSFRSARRLRVGGHRVLYRIEPPGLVLVVKIGRRREVYEG